MTVAAGPEIHVVVLWEHALYRQAEILADIEGHFRVCESFRVSWDRDRFSDNLARFYGDSLPAGSSKEVHCGSGSFLAVVVEDPQPSYERRRTRRRVALVNASLFDAKQRYRRWTGGGHRVHASLTRAEALRDIFLLLDRPAESFLGTRPLTGLPTEWPHNLVGVDGWRDTEQLIRAVSSVTPCRVVEGPVGRLELVVDDLWWSHYLLSGHAVDEPTRERDSVVEIAGTPTPVRLRHSGVEWNGDRGPWRDRLASLLEPFARALRGR